MFQLVLAESKVALHKIQQNSTITVDLLEFLFQPLTVLVSSTPCPVLASVLSGKISLALIARSNLSQSSPIFRILREREREREILCSREFRAQRENCLTRPDHFWNSALCLCESRSVATRGLPDHFPCRGGAGGQVSSRLGTNLSDVILWLCLGSSLTLIAVLTLLTKHYRAKFVKQRHQNKRTTRRGSFNQLGHEADPRCSNSSSASLELEPSLPYKAQLEHFLASATRDTRRSRELNILTFTFYNLYSCISHLERIN